MIKTIFAISLGASLGAILRWFLGLKLNSMFENIPAGTLCANLLGAYLIGITMTIFAQNTNISAEWKLLIVTGFLGGLTTFSTFSAEIVTLLQSGKYYIALFEIGLHLLGSILMTLLGILTIVFFSRFM